MARHVEMLNNTQREIAALAVAYYLRSVGAHAAETTVRELQEIIRILEAPRED